MCGRVRGMVHAASWAPELRRHRAEASPSLVMECTMQVPRPLHHGCQGCRSTECCDTDTQKLGSSNGISVSPTSCIRVAVVSSSVYCKQGSCGSGG